MKAYKVTISGYYTGNNNDVIDYEDVSGIVPFNEEETAIMHVRGRYAQMWLTADSRYPDRVSNVQQVHIDKIEEVTHDMSYIGKDIREMTAEEIQDLAAAKDLREIPLYKIGSLRDAREAAYRVYSKNVLKEPVVSDFNLATAAPLCVDSNSRKDSTRRLTNDEVISASQNNDRTALSRRELETLALQQGITYHPSISDQNLYKKIYS